MKAIACIVVFTFLETNILAQDLSVNAGIRSMSTANLTESLNAPRHFRYKQFQKGKIVYKDGKISEDALFNYDFVGANMLTIQQKGDTTVLQNSRISHYQIGNIVFLNSPMDIIEIHPGKGDINLGVAAHYVAKRYDQISSNGYQTGYDATGGTSASSRGLRKVIMDNTFNYYICMNDNQTIFKATRKKIVKAFIKRIPKIEDYMDENNINFKSGQDLEELVAYLNTSTRTN